MRAGEGLQEGASRGEARPGDGFDEGFQSLIQHMLSALTVCACQSSALISFVFGASYFSAIA